MLVLPIPWLYQPISMVITINTVAYNQSDANIILISLYIWSQLETDVFILLSKREGFGLTVIQASSCCVPIIGTNIVGLKDSVLDNKTGILINSLDNKSDYNKILKFLKNKKLRDKFANNGRFYVKKNFEKSNVIRFLKNELLRVLT